MNCRRDLSAGRVSGFTLVELLVAISLLALVSVLGYRGLDSMLRGREGLDKRSAELAALNETWRWLARDLNHLVPSLPATVGVPRLQAATDEHGNAVLSLAVHAEPALVSSLESERYQLVTYRIAASGLERTARSLLSAQDDALNRQVISLAPASRWRVASWSPVGSWVDSPAGASGESAAIQVSLTLFDQQFIRVFSIPL